MKNSQVSLSSARGGLSLIIKDLTSRRRYATAWEHSGSVKLSVFNNGSSYTKQGMAGSLDYKDHKPVNTTSHINQKDLGRNQVRRKEAFVIFTIFLYIFTKDDHEIDKKEEKIIQKLMKLEGNLLKEEEIDLLLDLAHNGADLESMLHALDKQKVTTTDFNNAFKRVGVYLKKTDRYIEFLKEIRNSFNS